MKHKILFLSIIFYCLSCKIAHAQFYNFFTGISSLEHESAALEMNNGFLFGFTETKSKKNFHENILLIKTNLSGHVTWSKRYDAGTNVSLHLIEMILDANNEIIISGIAGPNNKFNGNNRCIIKLSTAGNFIWAKKYSSDNPYDFTGLVQLKNSSFVFSLLTKKSFPAVVQIDKAGNVLTAMQVTNRMSETIHSITTVGNSADIIVGENNFVTINFNTGKSINQRQYNTSNQFNALLSTRCKNSDIVYLAGRNSGGTLNGNSRIYRTTVNGNLLWAKNLDATVDNTHSVFSIFDITSQVAVHEDINGNIVAVVQAESTQNLMIVFNAAGKYLYHRLFYSPFSFIAETKNGSYLHCAVSENNVSGKTIISNRFLSPLTNCDSTIFVKITNGIDSAATLDKLIFSSATITATDIAVTVQDTVIKTEAFCDLSSPKENNNNDQPEIQVIVMPNPATNYIIVKTPVDLPLNIYSITGTLKIKSTTNHSTDISTLYEGIYMIEIAAKNGVIRKMIIKK